MAGMSFSQFWRLEVRDQLLPCPDEGHLLPVSPQGREGEEARSLASLLIRTLIPSWGAMVSSNVNHPPKAASPNAITSGSGLQSVNSDGGEDAVRSPAPCDLKAPNST